MPARTIPAEIAPSIDQVPGMLKQLAGVADDPVGYVRIRWGAHDAGTRVLRLQVIDRLEVPYAPLSFQGYRRRVGTAAGRWVVEFYIANTHFGTPIAGVASLFTKGKQFSEDSGFYRCETDEKGAIELTITKGGDQTWCHAGIQSLLRSRSIEWTTSPDDDAVNPIPQPGGNPGGGGKDPKEKPPVTPTGQPQPSYFGAGDIVVAVD